MYKVVETFRTYVGTAGKLYKRERHTSRYEDVATAIRNSILVHNGIDESNIISDVEVRATFTRLDGEKQTITIEPEEV